MTISIRVDGKTIEAESGVSVLDACLENGIYIPHLCHIPGAEQPQASCRLCFVQLNDDEKPVCACTVRVAENMEVTTDTPAVRRLQRSSLRLLLSVHDVDCKNCHANRKCELQNIARFLKVGLKPKGLSVYLKETTVDESHPVLNHYPNRCVLCGRCLAACEAKNGGRPGLALARRGFDTVVSFYGFQEDGGGSCTDCTACVEACPVGALQLKATDSSI